LRDFLWILRIAQNVDNLYTFYEHLNIIQCWTY